MTLDFAERIEPKFPDSGLGRHKHFDARSANFPIRTLIAPALMREPRSYTWTVPTVSILDQGTEGACVGFSWTHELIARPTPIAGLAALDARGLYINAQERDPWPGTAPEYEGTTVLAGAKAVQAFGFITEYRWAFGFDEALAAIAWTGPVVLGLNWYESMFEPDPGGHIRIAGSVAGGHAILANAISVTKKRVGLVNSWGPGWGQHGRCWLTFDDFRRLLDEDGEVCVPVGRRRPHTMIGSMSDGTLVTLFGPRTALEIDNPARP